jgi:hypothetical protein
MQRSTRSPDEFIASLPDDVRDDIATLDRAISDVMAGHERVLWEGKFWGGTDQHIVGYGSYAYKGRSGASGEWFVIGLAAQKNYITVYGAAPAADTVDGRAIRERLGKAKIGRSTVTFKRLSDVDLATLIELVGRARDVAPS